MLLPPPAHSSISHHGHGKTTTSTTSIGKTSQNNAVIRANIRGTPSSTVTIREENRITDYQMAPSKWGAGGGSFTHNILKLPLSESHSGCHQPCLNPFLAHVCQASSPVRLAVHQSVDPVNIQQAKPFNALPSTSSQVHSRSLPSSVVPASQSKM